MHLQLCNNAGTGASTGAPRCLWVTSCKGAAPGISGNADVCYPYHVWSGTPQSSGVYWAPALNNGTFITNNACGTGYCSGTLAFSVPRALVSAGFDFGCSQFFW